MAADNSILQALAQNGGSRARATISSPGQSTVFLKAALALGLIGFLGAGAWWAVQSAPSTAGQDLAAAQPVVASPPTAYAASAAVPAPSASASTPLVVDESASAPEAVAKLETLPESRGPAPAAETPMANPLMKAMAAAASAPTSATAATAATAKATDKAPLSTVAPSGASQNAAKSDALTARRAAPERPVGKPEAQTAARNSKPAAATARSGAGKNDPDVELVAALMTHLLESERSAARARFGGSVSRDEITIAGLVRSCSAKPAPESDQCWRDICRDYWGKADACPAAKRVSVSATEPRNLPMANATNSSSNGNR